MHQNSGIARAARLLCYVTVVACWANLGQHSSRAEETPPTSQRDSIVADDLRTEARAEIRIRQTLQETTTMEFIETPLIDVIDYLEEFHGIQIEVELLALDAVGLGSDTPLTRELTGISLKSALNLVLGDLELTYLIDNEVLLITTLEKAQVTPVTRVYNLKGLLDGDRTPDQLLEAVTLGWVVGEYSPGQAVTFGDRLIVRAPFALQEGVARTLAMLRANSTDNPGSSASAIGLYPVADELPGAGLKRPKSVSERTADSQPGSETARKASADRGSDPFGAGGTGSDPFGAGGTGSDPFGAGGTDPFGAGGSDPFGEGGSDPFGGTGSDPFGAGGTDPFGAGGSDPFGEGGSDPFGGESDPFGKSGERRDPFGGTAKPVEPDAK